MKSPEEIDFAAEVDALPWPSDEDIASVVEVLCDPAAPAVIPPATADRLIRRLIAIAKCKAYSAGIQRGLERGEVIAKQVVRETLLANGTPRGSA